MYGMAAHYAAKHPHQSVEDEQPFEMGPKEVKHMQKVAVCMLRSSPLKGT